MNYPDHIYRKFEIIEKDILGVKHYALVEIINILGFDIKIKRRVDNMGFIFDVKGFAQTWHKDIGVIKETIEYEKYRDEKKYYEKHVS